MVGFYGGIDYGFGYFGRGYEGGRWENGRFFYNRAVNNVDVTIVRNVYESRVVNENRTTRVSYNGGNGGVNVRPTPQEEAAARARHLPPVAPQIQHIQVARTNPQLRASVNQGRPPIAATPKPGALSDRAVVPARQAGAPYHPPANRGRTGQPRNEPATSSGNNNSRPANSVHVRDLAPAGRPSAPNTGNPKLDQKYQRQQEKLSAQQDKERQKLQQRQEQDHQRMTQQRDAGVRKQQLEQRHQQQTQQLQQKHQSQQQQMQQRQQPPSQSGARPPKGKQ